MNGDEMTRCAREYALTLPFTEACWPFGPEYDVYKAGGKMFMLTTVLRGQPLINLKAGPEMALLHRAIYASIRPGYHMNKRHWISVYGGEDITPELLKSLIDDSRQRVIATLPKRVRQRLCPPCG